MGQIWNLVLAILTVPDIQMIISVKQLRLKLRFQSKSLGWRKEFGVIGTNMLLKAVRRRKWGERNCSWSSFS